MQQLLASQACMTAAHRRETSELRAEMEELRSLLAAERACSVAARDEARSLQARLGL